MSIDNLAKSIMVCAKKVQKVQVYGSTIRRRQNYKIDKEVAKLLEIANEECKPYRDKIDRIQKGCYVKITNLRKQAERANKDEEEQFQVELNKLIQPFLGKVYKKKFKHSNEYRYYRIVGVKNSQLLVQTANSKQSKMHKVQKYSLTDCPLDFSQLEEATEQDLQLIELASL